MDSELPSAWEGGPPMTATAQKPEPEPAPPPVDDNKPLPVSPVNVAVNTKEVDNQVNSGPVTNQHNYFGHAKQQAPVSGLRQDLPPRLPRDLHPFRAPDHEQLLAALKEQRLVILASYKADAAYAAAHALVYDPRFNDNKKRTLYVTRQRDKERADLELLSVTEGDVLDVPQIFLIGIRSQCVFLESVVDAHEVFGTVWDRLEQSSSYIVLCVDQGLLEREDVAEKLSSTPIHKISHLRYLLFPYYEHRVAEFEWLDAALAPLSTPAEQREHYQRIAECLSNGIAAFEKLVEERKATMHLAPEMRTGELHEVQPATVFIENSSAHRAAIFVATYFPEINQADFDRLVRLLLGGETTTREDLRQAFRRDGKLITTREKIQERCEDFWDREADKIFHDCHLRTVASENGSRVIDFCETYLREQFRSYLDKHHPWYLRRQCERLQSSGALFDDELSPKAVEGIVKLFVDRAIVDPAGFGSFWLVRLVGWGRAALRRSPLPDSPDELFEWLAKELAKANLGDRFQDRLCVLLREMFHYDGLRPVVDQFFDGLLRSKQHDALLEIILDLTPRLRFAPDFDPLFWILRLFNEGSDSIREHTLARLVDLGRRSGPKIYEFLTTIHEWLSDCDQTPEEFRHLVALKFPFIYCAEMSKWVTTGLWPSQHPLFYALPEDKIIASEKIELLIAWIVDQRDTAFENIDDSDPLKSAEAKRISRVADLVEHWAWVLEGSPSQTPPPEGRALFDVILEKLDSRLDPRERTWLLRNWQRRQEEQLKEAGTRSGQKRRDLIARKTKLEQLRVRYASMANVQRIHVQGEPAS
jgi:hypothetical protein